MDTKRDTGSPTAAYTVQSDADRRARAGGRRTDVGLAVYRRLRDLIVTGRLGPGAPLIEADLSKRLAASRTPVRAALRRLGQEGFVSPSPVGQALRPIVAPLTAGDLAEVFQMAGAFEAAAAREAAALMSARRAALVSELTADAGGEGGAGQTNPPACSASQALDGRFHRILADAGAGPRMRGELDVLYLQAARYARAYGQATPQAVARARAEHLAIARALAKGNGNLAGRRVAAHWRHSMARLEPLVSLIGEQGTW